MSNELNISNALNSKVLKSEKVNKTVEKRRQTALLIAIKNTIGLDKTCAYEIMLEITSNYRTFDECISKIDATLEAIRIAKCHNKDIYQAIGSLISSNRLDYTTDQNLANTLIYNYQTTEYHESTPCLEIDLNKFKYRFTQMELMHNLYPNEYLRHVQKNDYIPNVTEIKNLIIDNSLPFYSPEEMREMRGVTRLLYSPENNS